MSQFNDSQPIFVQIRQRIVEMILSKTAEEGEALPSVRQIAADLSVNPLTVTKAYEALVDIGVVESRRGMGMFVNTGARDKLLAHEREKFLERGLAAHRRPDQGARARSCKRCSTKAWQNE